MLKIVKNSLFRIIVINIMTFVVKKSLFFFTIGYIEYYIDCGTNVIPGCIICTVFKMCIVAEPLITNFSFIVVFFSPSRLQKGEKN